MKGLYFNGKKLILKDDIPKPRPKKGEALVRVIKAGVCNTDIEITKGYMNFRGVAGHEFVGMVEKSADKKFLGKRVCGEINLACGRCEYCAEGMGNHCPARKVLGILSKDGCFAEFITLPEKNLHIVSSSVSDDEAVFTEPLAACFETLKQVKINENDRVAVMGDGKLGLLMAQVAGLKSQNVVLVGRHEEHLKLAKGQGLSVAVLEKSKRMEALKREKCHIVIDCAGTPEGLSLSMDIVKPRGKIVLKSTFAGGLPLNLAPLVINEVTVIGSRCGPFPDALRALQSRKINVASLISKKFPLSHGIEAMEYAKKRGVLKVILDVS